MGSTITVIAVICVALLDAVTSFLLLIHGNQLEQFTTAVSSFTFQSSLLDLWALSILRVALLLGSSIGILCNPKDGSSRVNKSNTAIVIVTGMMVIFAIVKLLVESESPGWFKNPWLWSLLVWTVLASFALYVGWIFLGSVKLRTRTGACVVGVNVNVNEGDRERLVGSTSSSLSSESVDGDDDDDDNDDGNSEKKEDESEGKKKKKKGSRRSLLRLFSYSKPDIPYIMVAFVGLLVSSAGEIFLPLYTGKVIDGIVVEKSRAKFSRAIIIMSVIALVSSLAAGVRGGMFKFTMARLNYRVNILLIQSILKQEIGFFDVTRTGNITSRLTSDTTVMSESLGLNMNIFLRHSIQIIGYVVMMLGLSWRLTVLALVAIPLVAAISDYYGDYYEKLAKQVQDSLAKANNVAEEAISTMRTVRSFANEDGEAEQYADKLTVTFKLRCKTALVYAGYMISNQLLELMFDVCTLYYGGHLVLKGVISGGQLVSFILYSLELGGSLENIASVYTGLMEAAGASAKVFEFIDRQPKITNDGQEMPSDLKGHIEFRNVTFGYPSRKDTNVLENVSFTASPGEVVALVGPSGGGKSTCVSLLQHFYEPQSGSVMLDGIPVSQLQHKFLHSQVAMVGQEPVLYARSIRDNISYGLTDCSNERIQAAAQQANAHKFISEQKDGYDTQTGEKGTQLSGGQKQRVAIARALVRNPKVLLLDEATSALDAESEHLVQQALYQNLKDRTILIIAHRLSTVEKANRIVVIDHGRVLEQGSHRQLIRKGGMYAKLVQRQLLAVEETKTIEEPDTNKEPTGKLVEGNHGSQTEHS